MRQIAFICYPQFQSLDLTGPMEVFAHARQDDQPCYQLRLLSKTGGEIASSSGLIVQTKKFKSLESIDTLVVVGGTGVYKALEDQATLDYIQAQASKARRIVSICSGSFMLAAAGLLTAKRATTHWYVIDKFAAAYPEVILEADAIYVRDGNISSSAGITAGIDLSLALVEEDLGRDITVSIARALVIYYRRPGGQSQFSEPLKAQSIDNKKFATLCEYILENLQADLSVTALARKAAMSERNFSRSFSAAVALPPGKYVEKIRLDSARKQLENTQDNLQAIAHHCGFNSAEVLRRLFKRHHQISPSEYRQHFSH